MSWLGISMRSLGRSHGLRLLHTSLPEIDTRLCRPDNPTPWENIRGTLEVGA